MLLSQRIAAGFTVGGTLYLSGLTGPDHNDVFPSAEEVSRPAVTCADSLNITPNGEPYSSYGVPSACEPFANEFPEASHYVVGLDGERIAEESVVMLPSADAFLAEHTVNPTTYNEKISDKKSFNLFISMAVAYTVFAAAGMDKKKNQDR